MKRERVVVTGVGLLTPLGIGVEASWSAIRAGASGTRTITSFDTSPYPSHMAGEVPGFAAKDWVNPRTMRVSGRTAHFALAATRQALDDSGWSNDLDGYRDAAVLLGVGYGSIASIEEAYRIYFGPGWTKNSPLTVPTCMPNSAGSLVALEHGFTGPSYTLAVACASGASAIVEGARLVRSGVVRHALVGGVDAVVQSGIVATWSRLGVLSRRNHDPGGACAPFSADRDGLVLGEGAAVVTLETLAAAERRGARVYAEIAGFGSACGAESITSPSLAGEVMAMRAALADGALDLEEVGYVNAHGTGTRLNDAIEVKALRETFGKHADRLAVSSTKSQLGHTMGASSAIECVVTALALRDQVLPPTINLREPDPECDLDFVPGQARAHGFEVALSNSFAFGGSNVIVALRRFVG